MRDGKRGDNRNQGSDTTQRYDQTKQKQKMIDTFENVQKAHLDKSQGCLMPARVKLNKAGIAEVVENSFSTCRNKKPQHSGCLF